MSPLEIGSQQERRMYSSSSNSKIGSPLLTKASSGVEGYSCRHLYIEPPHFVSKVERNHAIWPLVQRSSFISHFSYSSRGASGARLSGQRVPGSSHTGRKMARNSLSPASAAFQ